MIPLVRLAQNLELQGRYDEADAIDSGLSKLNNQTNPETFDARWNKINQRANERLKQEEEFALNDKAILNESEEIAQYISSVFRTQSLIHFNKTGQKNAISSIKYGFKFLRKQFRGFYKTLPKEVQNKIDQKTMYTFMNDVVSNTAKDASFINMDSNKLMMVFWVKFRDKMIEFLDSYLLTGLQRLHKQEWEYADETEAEHPDNPDLWYDPWGVD
jgi:hypothetical protein